MLIITGLGRTGTSLIAAFCIAMGYDVGGRWFEERNAGFEDRELIDINTSLSKKDANFDNNRIFNYYKKVVKDPRFFLYSNEDIISKWSALRKDLKFVVTTRSFDNIAASRNALGHDQFSSESELKLRFSDAISQLLSNKIPFTFLEFPDFIDDFEVVYDALCHFGDLEMNYSQAKEEWLKLVDKSKVHFT